MNKKSMLTRFGPAQIVASVALHPRPEHWLQISRVILAFANGNKLILTVERTVKARVRSAPRALRRGKRPRGTVTASSLRKSLKSRIVGRGKRGNRRLFSTAHNRRTYQFVGLNEMSSPEVKPEIRLEI